MIMKKRAFTAFITAAALCAAMLSGCGDSESVETKTVEKSVAVYFSRVGNTEFDSDVDVKTSASLNRENGELKGNAQLIAEYIADEAKCGTVEIVSQDSYPADYDETVDIAKKEQGDKKRPKLKNSIDLKDVDTIWLVTANWWYDLPMPVYSFFEEYDLSGKNIFVFVTHEGSGFSKTIDTIRELEPDAQVVEGLSVRGGKVKSEEKNIRERVKELM